MVSLRIGSQPVDPFVLDCFPDYPSDRCPYPGPDMYVLWLLLRSIGITTNFVRINNTATHDQELNLLADGSVDAIGRAMRLTELYNYTNISRFPALEDHMDFITIAEQRDTLGKFVMLRLASYPLLALTCTFTLALWAFRSNWALANYPRTRTLVFMIDQSWQVILFGVYSNLLAIVFTLSQAKDYNRFTTTSEFADCLMLKECHMILPMWMPANLLLPEKGSSLSSKDCQDCDTKLEKALRLTPPSILKVSTSEEVLELLFEARSHYRYPTLIDFSSRIPSYQATQYGSRIRSTRIESSNIPLYGYLFQSDNFSAETREKLSIAFSAGSVETFYYSELKSYFQYEGISTAGQHSANSASRYPKPLTIMQLFDVFAIALMAYGVAAVALSLEKLYRCQGKRGLAKGPSGAEWTTRSHSRGLDYARLKRQLKPLLQHHNCDLRDEDLSSIAEKLIAYVDNELMHHNNWS